MVQPRKIGTALAVLGVSAFVFAGVLSTVTYMSDPGEPAPAEPDRTVTIALSESNGAPGAAASPRTEEGRVGRKAARREAGDREMAENAGVLGARKELLLQTLGTTSSAAGSDAAGESGNATVLSYDSLGDDATVAGLDAALQGVSGVQQVGVGGLVGAKSGAGGLAQNGVGVGGGGGLGAAEGLGGLGTKGIGSGASGYGSGGGAYGRRDARYDRARPSRTQSEAARAGEGDGYATIAENAFATVGDAPLSTFSVDVDTASYSNVRRFLEDGEAPPRDAVRIEELLNYFPYDYAPPTDGRPFAAHAEVTEAPWAAGHRLVRIGLKGKVPAARATPPRNLVFLVDVSGSMLGDDRLGLVQRGLAMLARQLGPEDTVSLVVYAGADRVVLEPTRGDRTETILAAIDGLQGGGSTAGAAGIRKAYALAREHYRKGAVNRVILATDGDFNVGVSSESELVRIVEEERKSGVFLTVLGVGRGNFQDAKMELLADKGNGNYAYVDTFPEMRKVLGEQASSTLDTIAKDVKIQVEWNPARVASWRLVGYENRVLAARDFADDTKDAGEIGAGHAVTALYEIVPARGAGTTAASAEGVPLRYQDRQLSEAAATDELLTVKLRYKPPTGDTSQLLSFPVRDTGGTFATASTDTRWAAAVAGYGMLLRDSPHKGKLGWEWVRATARGALGTDAAGYRAEFLGLVEKARRLGG